MSQDDSNGEKPTADQLHQAIVGGKSGQAVMTRLMGLLLIAIASNMIIHGIKHSFGLAS